jgi:hypothetical protein
MMPVSMLAQIRARPVMTGARAAVGQSTGVFLSQFGRDVTHVVGAHSTATAPGREVPRLRQRRTRQCLYRGAFKGVESARLGTRLMPLT